MLVVCQYQIKTHGLYQCINSVATTAAPISNPPSQTTATTPSATPSLALMLLYAFIGGLILNVMPCVLPVIALKTVWPGSCARSEPRRVRNLGFIYALGVLASFSTLAIIVIGINAAGHRAGWGLQFGNPVFVVCMTTLITLVALNLFGVFEAGRWRQKPWMPRAISLPATALAAPFSTACSPPSWPPHALPRIWPPRWVSLSPKALSSSF